MKLIWGRYLSAVGGLAMLVATSGCMTTEGGPTALMGLGEEPSSPEVAAFLDHDVEYALEETIIEGAVIGAAALGIGCALLGGGRSCLAVAAGGAVAGGLAGAAVAEGNRQQEVYKKEQNELAQQLAAERQGLQVRGQKLEAAVASLRKQKRDLSRQYSKGQITLEQRNARAAALRRDADRINAKNDAELEQLDKREASIADTKMTSANSKQFERNASTMLRHDQLGEEVALELDDFVKNRETS